MTITRHRGISAHRYAWLIIVLIWLTNMLSFFDRQAMAFAAPFIAKEIGYGTTTIGLIVGIVFASYAVAQIPGGRLADKFGQRRWVILGVIWWTVFSVLTGAVAHTLLLLVVVRLMMGVGEGIVPPSTYRIIANWFTEGRRTFALGAMLTSAAIGPAIAPLIAAPIIAAFDWRAVFYFSAIPGIVIAGLLWIWLRDSPSSLGTGGASAPQRDVPAPEAGPSPSLRDLVTTRLVVNTLAIFFLFFALYGINAWLPTYLSVYRGLDLEWLAAFSSLPYIAGVVGMLIGAALCNGPLKNHRIAFVVAGTSGTALSIVGVWAAPDAIVGEVFLVLALFCTYMIFGPAFSTPMDSVPTSGVGTYLGAINMAPQIAGVVAPIIIGAIVGPHTFVPAFIAMVVALLLSICCQLWVAQSDRRFRRTTADDSTTPGNLNQSPSITTH
jgi:sugar phosphate permease